MAAEEAAERIKAEPFKEHVVRLMKKIETIPESSMDVFLWDLIHISIGDLLRYRYFQLSVKNVPDPRSSLGIRIIADTRKNTLTIIDGGFGRNTADLMSLIVNLSPYDVELFEKKIDECLVNAGGGRRPSAYYEIEGICLGVYAAFMVAKRVVITTKPVDDDHVYVWESEGLIDDDGSGSRSGSYTITRRAFDPKTSLPRGTVVTLYLKEDKHLKKYLDLDELVPLVHLLDSRHCPYTIEVIEVVGEGKPPKRSGKISFIDNKSEDITSLDATFEPLKQVCRGILHGWVKKVVISDRVYDLPCAMDVDKTEFEINPRHHSIKLLLDDYLKDPDGEKDRVAHTFQLHYHMLDAWIQMRMPLLAGAVYHASSSCEVAKSNVAKSDVAHKQKRKRVR